MKRRVFLTAGGSAVLAACSSGSIVDRSSSVTPQLEKIKPADDGNYGGDTTGKDLLVVQQALLPSALAGTVMAIADPAPPTAKRVILSNIPFVTAQGVPGHFGSPGTCEAQGFGHGLGGYTAARSLDGRVLRDTSLSENVPSAAWLYMWQQKVYQREGPECPKGTQASPYLIRLTDSGAPSAAEVPYNPHHDTTVDSLCAYLDGINPSTSYENEDRFLIGSYKAISKIQHGMSKYLDPFKEFLRYGQAIGFTGLVPNHYSIAQPIASGNVYTVQDGFIEGSGHSQFIVGYDDDLGAFLVQNSFGTGWNAGDHSDPGRNGRIWYAYESFFAGQLLAMVAYPNAAPISGGVHLKSSETGKPSLTLHDAKIHTDSTSGDSVVILVLQASAVLGIKSVSIVTPDGKHFSSSLEEQFRIGYFHVGRDDGEAFARGTYSITVTATDVTQSATYNYTASVKIPHG
jgi:hypothetical protein